MGDSWARLAEPVRLAHDTHSVTHGYGRLRVEHGRHLAARVLARALRLPRPSIAADTRLTVTARHGVEYWQRMIDGRPFNTSQCHANAFGLAERFGLLELRFRLEEAAGSLVYVHRSVALRAGPLRLAIPAWCAPRVEAREGPAGPTAVRVSVRINLPVIGLLIAYDGRIDIQESLS
jgi:hypothetical protein